MGPQAASGPVSGTLSLRGVVHGGQPPVAGSTITLYAAGSTGYGSAASSRLLLPVFSDASGNFTITGDYTCTNANDQLYIVARGGNPGLAAGTSNAALTMMSVLGTCSQAPNLPFITINEVTTVAAAWAMAPFVGTDAAHIGTSSGNAAGLSNAMLNARQVVDITTGAPATLPANLTTEPGKINSLANSIATCVNSNGGSACTPLFSAATPAGGSAPTDTFMASVDIVRNPGTNVATVYSLASGFPPFVGLSSAPNDWTLSRTSNGNGLHLPTYLGLDSVGDVWVTNYGNPLSKFDPQGGALGSFGAGDFNESYGLVVDLNDSVWLTQEENPGHGNTKGSLAHYNSAGTRLGYSYNNGIDFPVSASTDTFGNIYIANYGNSTATIWNNNSAVYSFTNSSGGTGSTQSLGVTSQGANELAFPTAVAADGQGTSSFPGGMWLANVGDNSVTHMDGQGNVLYRPTSCCSGANGVAVDSAGNAWAGSYYNSVLTELTTNSTYTNFGGRTNCSTACNGGLYYPAGVAVDGNQDVWIASYRGNTFSGFAGITRQSAAGGAAVSAGTPLTPESIYAGNGNVMQQGGLGLDASLLLPSNIATDASGDLWVSSYGNDGVVMFFGLATPLKTPIMPIPVRP